MRWVNELPQDWLVSEFQKIAELKHGYQFRNYDYTNDGIKIFKITQIEGEGKINISNCSTIDKNRLDQFERVVLNKGDILMALTGATIGKIAKFNSDELVLQNYRVGNFLPLNSDVLDKEYFFQFLRTDFFYNQIISNQTQSAQQNIGKEDINKMLVILPPLPEQRAIASILSALDDKIELNLQMNKTLEEMAMALYKHWFVDFGPFRDGEFATSELGEIPKGWEVKRLDEFVELTMGQSPKSEFYNNSGVGLPFHQGVSDYGDRFPTDRMYSTEGSREAMEGDILFSVRAPVGRINIAKNKIILGRGLASMRMPGNNNFLFYSLKSMFSSEDIIGSGTVFNSVNKTDLHNLKFVIPSKNPLKKFKEIVVPLDAQYFSNFLETQILTTLRDTLLPKLISGEVRVKDAAKSLAEII